MILKDFLQQHGFKAAALTPLTADWSARRYWRLEEGNNPLIVLACPPDNSPEATPGHKLGDLIRINRYLAEKELSTPACLAVDIEHGFAVFEDFGSTPLTECGAPERHCAVESLIHLQQNTTATDIALPAYADTHLPKKLNLYAQHVLGNTTPELLGALQALAHVTHPVFSLVDFRSGNVHWLKERAGIQRIGFLDVQGAVAGDAVYDLVTFLEDIRVDLPAAEKEALKAVYRNALPNPAFEDHYARWQFVFQAGVLGQLRARQKPHETQTLERDIEARLKALATRHNAFKPFVV